MNGDALERFFARQSRRAARHVALASALLAGRGVRYMFGRGSLLFARVPLRVALHTAEVVVLSDFLELGVVGYLLALRSVATALGALHWGALEPLRQAVRRDSARGAYAAAELTIARYLRLSVDWCVALLVLLVAWLRLGPRPFDGFSIIDAYAVSCALRAMTEAVTRTYHAGAFALRRVYRPFGALLAVDLVDVGAMLLLWPWLGPWAFALAQLLGAGADAVLTASYTRRTYATLRIAPPRLRDVVSERARLEPGTWRRSLGPALGNLISQVDALLIAALALGVSHSGLAFAAGLHVLRPVLSLSGSWAKLFYFDLSRLDDPVQALFRARLERSLLRAAPLFALAAAVTGVLIAAALAAGRVPVSSVPWLLPFLGARSVYAAAQVQAFARGRYSALLAGSLVVAAGAWTILHLGATPASLVLAAPATLLSAALAFACFPTRRRNDGGARAVLVRPLTFLRRLAELRQPLALHLLWLPPRAAARAPALARALEALPGVLLVSRFGKRRLAVASQPNVTRRELVKASAGGLHDARTIATTNGNAALEALLASELVSTWAGSEGKSALAAPSVAELRRGFTERFAGGVVLDARSGELEPSLASTRELAWTLSELSTLAAGGRLSRRRGLPAAVFAPGGEAELVFVAPRSTDAAAFAEFQRLVLRASVLASQPAHAAQ